MAGASAAFSAIKKGIEVGRGLQDMSGQLSKWAGAMSDLSRAEVKNKNPPWWKSLSGNVEQEAMEIFAAKKKAQEMRKELKFYISFNMGPSAWEELLSIESQVRKRKQDQEYRNEEVKESIINWSVGTLAVLVGSGILTTVFYFIGMQQGKW